MQENDKQQANLKLSSLDCEPETMQTIDDQAPSQEYINQLAKRYWYEPKLFARSHPEFSHRTHSRRTCKHIAIFFHELGIGGGEVVTRRLAELWTKIGYRVTILTNVPHISDDKHQPIPDGVDLKTIPDFTKIEPENYSIRGNAFRSLLIDNDIDAVVFAHWFWPTLPYDILTAKSLGIFSYIYIQSSFSLFYLDAGLPPHYMEIPYVYSFADGVIALSEMDRHYWSHFSDRVYSYVNPPSLPMPSDVSQLTGHTIIWPARLHVDKCPERVIPIMQNVVKRIPDAKLVMVGPVDAQTIEAFTKHIIEAELDNNIEIIGPQNPQGMMQWYLKSDAFLLTSRREGWSLALAEALSAGLPCVIYELPYLTLAKNNPAIIQIPQGCDEDASQALAELLLDKSEAKLLGAKGREFISKVYSFDHKGFWDNLLKATQRNEGDRPNHAPRQEESMVIDEVISSHKAFAEKNAEIISEQQDSINRLNQIISQLQAENEQLSNSIKCIRSSMSFRLGRTMTSIPRRLRDAIKTGHHSE